MLLYTGGIRLGGRIITNPTT